MRLRMTVMAEEVTLLSLSQESLPTAVTTGPNLNFEEFRGTTTVMEGECGVVFVISALKALGAFKAYESQFSLSTTGLL